MAELPSWPDFPLVLTTAQVADLLHLHVNSVKALCRSGKLPAVKVGKAWRIQRADVLTLLSACSPDRAPGLPPGHGEAPGDVHEALGETQQILHEQAGYLAALHEIERSVLLLKTPAELALMAANRIRSALAASRVAIVVFDWPGHTVEILAADGVLLDRLPVGLRTSLDDYPFQMSSARREMEIVPDLSTVSAVHGWWQKDACTHGIRSYINVPLVVGEEVIGAVAVGRAEPGTLAPRGLAFAQQAADALAVALFNARLLARVQAAQIEHQELSRRLVEVQEAERRAIARDLHDEAGQILSALKLRLNLLRRNSQLPAELSGELGELQDTTDEVMAGLHQLAVNLRPPSLDRYGLVPALEQYIAMFARGQDLRVEFLVEGFDQRRLTDQVETALYRIVQEALTNVRRHAHASRVSVVLSERGSHFSVAVEDDGVGFDVVAALRTGRLGLLGMRERVEMLGGTLDIQSAPSGTCLRANFPTVPERGVSPASPESPYIPPHEPQPFVSLSVADDRARVAEVSSSASAELARAKALGDRLHDLHLALAALTDTDAILQRAAADGAAALACDSVAILFHEGAEWVVRGEHGLPAEALDSRLGEDEFPELRHALSSGEVVAVNDFQDVSPARRRRALEFGIHAVILVPISLTGQVTGVAVFSGHLPGRRFLPSEVEFARRLAATLSMALESASLRRAEAMLLEENRNQRHFLERLIEAVPTGIAVVRGPEHRFELANPAYRSIPTGQSDTPLLGRTFAEVFPAVTTGVDALDRIYRDAQAIRSSESAANLGPGREVSYWDLSLVPLVKPEDATQVEGVLILTTDVTGRVSARREIEQLAAEAQARAAQLDAVLAAIPDGLLIYDAQGRILRMNHKAAELLGYDQPTVSDRSMVQRTVFGVPLTLDGQPYPMERWPLARALRGERVHGEILALPPSAVRERTLWVAIGAAPIYEADGSLTGVVAMISDITPLRTVQMELEAANANLQEMRNELERRVEARTQELALANAALRGHSEQLEIINRIDRAILASKSTAEIAHIALKGIRGLTGATRASIHRFNMAKATAELLATEGTMSPDSAPGMQIPVTASPILEDVFAGQTVQVEDVAAFAERSHVAPTMLALGIRSILAVPLKMGEQQRGALILGRETQGPWPPEAVALTTQVADSLAVALANAHLYAEVQSTGDQLQALSRRLLDLQESERHRVADQLYNEAAQVLAALKFQLNVTTQELAARAPEGHTAVSERVVQMQTMADRILADLHDLAVNLRPASLDRLGLAPALQQYAEEFGREYGLDVQFEALNLGEVAIPARVDTALYRCAQEALSNVAHHAQATSVGVGLTYANGRLSLLIEDNGIGFDSIEVQRRGALGLFGMRERLAAIGGSLTIESAPGAGTTLYVEVNLDSPDCSN